MCKYDYNLLRCECKRIYGALYSERVFQDYISFLREHNQIETTLFLIKEYADLDFRKEPKRDQKKVDIILRKEMYLNTTSEERYLIFFRDVCGKYLNSAKWLLHSDEADKKQFYYDMSADFELLCESMKKFEWSKDFLKENGIDYKSFRKLYFAVADK